VQAVPALGPSPSSSLEGGGNKIPELTGTLATTAPLELQEKKEDEGLDPEVVMEGGGLRSRKGPTYLVGAAAVILATNQGLTTIITIV
jgi:hypothetical protein